MFSGARLSLICYLAIDLSQKNGVVNFSEIFNSKVEWAFSSAKDVVMLCPEYISLAISSVVMIQAHS